MRPKQPDYFFGWCLYWTVMRLPYRWWSSREGWFFWALPLIGYYAFYEPANGDGETA